MKELRKILDQIDSSKNCSLRDLLYMVRSELKQYCEENFILEWGTDWVKKCHQDSKITDEEARKIISELQTMDTIECSDDIIDYVIEYREKNPKNFTPYYTFSEFKIEGRPEGVDLFAHITEKYSLWLGTFPTKSEAEEYLRGLEKSWDKEKNTFNVWYEVKIYDVDGNLSNVDGTYLDLDDALEYTRDTRDTFCDDLHDDCKIVIEQWHNAKGSFEPTDISGEFEQGQVDYQVDISRTVLENLEYWNLIEAQEND